VLSSDRWNDVSLLRAFFRFVKWCNCVEISSDWWKDVSLSDAFLRSLSSDRWNDVLLRGAFLRSVKWCTTARSSPQIGETMCHCLVHSSDWWKDITLRGAQLRSVKRCFTALSSDWLFVTSTSVSTWMGDRQGRPSAVNLCPFVGVDLNLWSTVYAAVIVLTWT